MASRVRRDSNRIRAIVFINTVIIAADCPRTGRGLQRWGEAFEGLDKPESSRKWPRYLRGVLMDAKLRARLVCRFIVLSMVLANPLWAVLAWLERLHGNRDELAQRLRLDGEPLMRRHFRRLRFRVAMGHWQDLGFLLAILASSSWSYLWARNFLRHQFTLFFLLICSQPELAGVTRLLFQVVDDHFRNAHLSPVLGWPSSVGQFKRHLKRVTRLRRCLSTLRPTDESMMISALIAAASGWYQDGEHTLDGSAVLRRCQRQVQQEQRIGAKTVMQLDGLKGGNTVFTGGTAI